MSLRVIFFLFAFFFFSLPLLFPSQNKGKVTQSDSKQKPLSKRSSKALLTYADWLFLEWPQKAEKVYEKIIKNFPKSLQTRSAYLGLGKCLVLRKRFLAAFSAIEKSFSLRPETEEIALRCNLEWQIGQKLAAMGQKVITQKTGFLQKKETGLYAASRIFRAILYNDPQGALTPQVLLALADAEFSQQKIKLAEKIYLQLFRKYPDNKLSNLARLRAAKCLSLRQGRHVLQRQDTIKARELLEKVEKTSLKSDNTQEMKQTKAMLQDKEAEEQLRSARYYLARRDRRARNSGFFILQELIRRFPGTQSSIEAAKLLQKQGAEPK